MRRVTLIDLGAGPLPAQTPPAARFAPWLVQVYAPPQPPVLNGLAATPVVDGVLLDWTPVPLSGAVYVVGIGEAQDGPFTELAQVDVPRYLYSNADSVAKWFSVTPSVRGVLGVGATVESAPKSIVSDEDLIELQRQIDEANRLRFEGDAKEAEDRAKEIAEKADELDKKLKEERDAREAAVAEERKRIDAIDDDEIISPVEKPQLRIDFAAVMGERDGINAQADLSEVVDEKTAYNDALDALAEHMETLTLPTRWDDPSGITYLT